MDVMTMPMDDPITAAEDLADQVDDPNVAWALIFKLANRHGFSAAVIDRSMVAASLGRPLTDDEYDQIVATPAWTSGSWAGGGEQLRRHADRDAMWPAPAGPAT